MQRPPPSPRVPLPPVVAVTHGSIVQFTDGIANAYVNHLISAAPNIPPSDNASTAKGEREPLAAPQTSSSSSLRAAKVKPEATAAATSVVPIGGTLSSTAVFIASEYVPWMKGQLQRLMTVGRATDATRKRARDAVKTRGRNNKEAMATEGSDDDGGADESCEEGTLDGDDAHGAVAGGGGLDDGSSSDSSVEVVG